MAALVAKRPRHPAASGVQRFEFQPLDARQQAGFRTESCDRFLMAMSMQERSRGQPRRRESGSLTRQELAEQQGPVSERGCPWVMREKRRQLVPESQDAARLQADDVRTAVDQRRK